MTSAPWLNSDGLLVKLGISEAADQVSGYAPVGEYRNNGPTRFTEILISDLTKLPAFGTVGILNDVSFFPHGAVIEQVTIEVVTAATGTGATLSLGLVKNSDRTTAISATALTTAGLLQTALTPAGTKINITAGSTGAGAFIGVANTFDALFTATVGTANFTAGAIRVRIDWRPTNNIPGGTLGPLTGA